jgi:hypothetical protein
MGKKWCNRGNKKKFGFAFTYIYIYIYIEREREREREREKANTTDLTINKATTMFLIQSLSILLS